MTSPDDSIDVTVRLRDDLSRPAGRAEEAVEDLGREVKQLDRELDRVDVSGAAAATAIGRVGTTSKVVSAQVDDLGDDAARTARQLKALERATKDAASANTAVAKSLEVTDAKLKAVKKASRTFEDRLTSMRKGLKSTMSDLRKFGRTLVTVFKLPAIITGVTLLIGLVSALGAASVAAVGALGPVVGVAAALPGLLIAVKSSTALIKASVGPSAEAAKVIAEYGANSKEAAEALSKLNPEARTFALQLGALQQVGEGLRTTAQRGLLPGLGEALERASVLTPIVDRATARLGATLGELARRAAGTATTPIFQRDLARIGETNARVVGFLGEGAIHLGRALVILTSAAGPMLESLALMFRRGSALAVVWLENKRNSGELTDFFTRSMTVFRGVLKFFRDIGVALINTFKGGAELGGDMGKSLGDLAERWREWSGSVEGQTAIKDFFNDAKPVVKEVGLLLKDVFKAFGSAGANGDLAPLIAQLRTELLPAVVELAGSFTGENGLGSSIIRVATAFSEALGAMEYGPLVDIAETVSGLLVGTSKLIDTVPGLGTFIATLLTVGILAQVPGMKMGVKLFARFGKAVATSDTTARLLGKSMGLLGKAARGLFGGLKLILTGLRLLSIALVTTPVGLVILGITLLVGALVLLYKKSETARNIMQAAFRGIGKVVLTVWDGILAGMQKVFEVLGKLPGKWGAPFRKAAESVGVARTALDGVKTKLDEIGKPKSILIELSGAETARNTLAGLAAQRDYLASPTARSGQYDRRLTANFAGGNVSTAERSIVGELGPELFVPRIGNISVVGADSPEVVKFSQPGYVVPAAGTPRSIAKDVPDWVLDRLGRAESLPAAVPGWAQAKAEQRVPVAAGGGDSTPYEPPLPPPQVHVHGGDLQAVEAAVERAYHRLEQQRRERSGRRPGERRTW